MSDELQFAVDIAWLINGPKITAYLLNPAHAEGASKARYLLGFGFTLNDPEALANALVEHAMNNLPGSIKPQKTGPNRIVFEGDVLAPDKRMMPLRTVWEARENFEMRFITAVPLTRQRRPASGE